MSGKKGVIIVLTQTLHFQFQLYFKYHICGSCPFSIYITGQIQCTFFQV
uniref:Uncharacterized protein n=1 Tax=Anguilla anguilla TaxID=7936 RepID=A0A0E9VFK3_ANGAN